MIAFGLYDTCKCIAARKYGTECSAVPWEQIYMLLNGNFGWDRDSSHGPSRIDPALRSATSSEPQGRAPYYTSPSCALPVLVDVPLPLSGPDVMEHHSPVLFFCQSDGVSHDVVEHRSPVPSGRVLVFTLLHSGPTRRRRRPPSRT